MRKGKDCVADKKCGGNQVWSDAANDCVCDQKSALLNNECRQCPTGSQPSPDGNSCICQSESKLFDSKTVTCVDRCGQN